jgi:hypothetical protein
MSSLAHSPQNDQRFDDFMSEVREFGRDEAAGNDALPKLAIKFVSAVADGVLDLSKDSTDRDGAARVYEAYAAASKKKAVHNRTAGGLKGNISKLRQLGVFASNPKFDPVVELDRAISRREALIGQEVKVKAAYAAYVDFAREANKFDDPLSDEAIDEVLKVAEKNTETTLEKELEKIQKKIEGFITGEDKHGIKDQSPELIQVQELITQRLAALTLRTQTIEALIKGRDTGIVTNFDSLVVEHGITDEELVAAEARLAA